MTGEFVLRLAREDDLPALIEIARRAWLDAFAQTVPFELLAWWASNDRVTARYQKNWPAMTVLEAGGEVLGLVQPQGDEINGLWVHPRHHGRGVGTRLLRAGEELIRTAGHPTAWLTCGGMNPKAMAFYLRRGYVETGRVRIPHESGMELEDVRMERRLTDVSLPPPLV